jgi:hypothetical protein
MNLDFKNNNYHLKFNFSSRILLFFTIESPIFTNEILSSLGLQLWYPILINFITIITKKLIKFNQKLKKKILKKI